MGFLDVLYEILAPDGTRAVVGNTSVAQQDPDWVGMLDPQQGIVGLLDAAPNRLTYSDLVEADGGTDGPGFATKREGTINVVLLPSSLDLVAIANAESKFKRATRAKTADGILRWTPPNDSSPRQLRFRRQAGPLTGGQRPKASQVTLTSRDTFALSSTEQSVVITPGAAAGESGIPNPIPSPITTTLNVTAQQFVVNAGDAPSWPRFRIDGPILNPQILNNTTGGLVALNYNLGVGEWLDVYPERGRVLLGGTADRYSAYDFAQSQWWLLAPGSNDVRLLASSFSSPAQLTVYYRSAWE